MDLMAKPSAWKVVVRCAGLSVVPGRRRCRGDRSCPLVTVTAPASGTRLARLGRGRAASRGFPPRLSGRGGCPWRRGTVRLDHALRRQVAQRRGSRSPRPRRSLATLAIVTAYKPVARWFGRGNNGLVDDSGDLPLADRLALGRLAYLRQRSLRNPHYRDAGHVRLHVTPRYLSWSHPSVFDPHLDAVRRSLGTFEQFTKKNSPDADDAWREVLVAVDELLTEGRRRAGHRIRARGI